MNVINNESNGLMLNPNLKDCKTGNYARKGVIVQDKPNDCYLVDFEEKKDSIKNLKLSDLKKGLLRTFSYYPPYLKKPEPYATFGAGGYTSNHIITEEGLAIISENCGEPIAGVALLSPHDEPDKELIDIYMSGDLDHSVQSFQYRRNGSGVNTFIFPIVVKGANLGAVEIKGREHVMHSIMNGNFCLLEQIYDRHAINSALNCFDIKAVRFSTRKLTDKDLGVIKSKLFTSAIISRINQ